MESIKIRFPDGNQKEFNKGITGYEIAESISPRLAQEVLAVKTNGCIKDLHSKFNEDASVKFLTFDDAEGKEVYWHSSSHLMAHAVKEIFPEAKFGVGPAIDAGFYYDIDIEHQLTEDDLFKIELRMLEIAKKDEKFNRQELSKSEALEFWNKRGDQYKLEIISGLDESSETISFYHEGNFTDLCTGPHLPSAGKIKFVKLLNISGSYWRGDEKNKQLQRIYGVSFPKKKMLDDHLFALEEAKKRDHRKLGKELELFFISPKIGQ